MWVMVGVELVYVMFILLHSVFGFFLKIELNLTFFNFSISKSI